MITTQEFEELADDLLKRQGYIVIGQPPNANRSFEIGATTRILFQFRMSDEYRIFAKAKQSDYAKQRDLIATLRPKWRRHADQIGGAFFKTKKAEAA